MYTVYIHTQQEEHNKGTPWSQCTKSKIARMFDLNVYIDRHIQLTPVAVQPR